MAPVESGTNTGMSWSELLPHKTADGANLLRRIANDFERTNVERHYHIDALGSVEPVTGMRQTTETSYRADARGMFLQAVRDGTGRPSKRIGYWRLSAHERGDPG